MIVSIVSILTIATFHVTDYVIMRFEWGIAVCGTKNETKQKCYVKIDICISSCIFWCISSVDCP